MSRPKELIGLFEMVGWSYTESPTERNEAGAYLPVSNAFVVIERPSR